MGLLDGLLYRKRTPEVDSMLPEAAIQAIMSGQLPILKTSRVFLNYGELCHYMDNAVYQKEKKIRVSNRTNNGYRMPGLFKGTAFYMGNGQTKSREVSEYIQIKGILFVTNQRIIFSSSDEGFVFEMAKLTALTPYTNAVEMQFSNKTYTIFVPNGNVVSNVVHYIKI